jgi:hypothetical protein
VGGATRAFTQLIASASLTSSEAEGMSLMEIVQYKFDATCLPGTGKLRTPAEATSVVTELWPNLGDAG